MELYNCFPTRSSRKDFRDASAEIDRLRWRRRTQANIAFMFVEPRGPNTLIAPLQPNPQGWLVSDQTQDGRYIIVAKSGQGGYAGHSESRCITEYYRLFGNANPRAKVTYVFTEREPCHDGPGGCFWRLANFLVVNGRHQERTKVRFYDYYYSNDELATAGNLDGRKYNRSDRKRSGNRATKRIRTPEMTNPPRERASKRARTAADTPSFRFR